MIKKVSTDKAPAAIGPYSQAVKSGSFMYTSGQIALDPDSGLIVEGGIKEQTEQVCKNLAAVLDVAGLDMQKVVKTTCFLKNISDFADFNEVYSKFFISKPARSCVEVAALPKNALVEIEIIAEL